MPPAQKICGEKRRDSAGDDFPCGLVLVELSPGVYRCPKTPDHVRPFKTGLCASGWHEGHKPRTVSGQPAATCRFWLVCGCDCHKQISEMFKMTGTERRLVENPEYVPVKITGLLSFEERAKLHAEAREQARVERVAKMADQPDGGDEIHSPSGRTRKGLLDGWVELQCKLWSMSPEVFGDCTPAWLSEQIALMQDVPAPSHGAVDAVLRRWAAVGYATYEGRPNRFTGFTEDGLRLGYEVLKQKKRLQMNSSRR